MNIEYNWETFSFRLNDTLNFDAQTVSPSMEIGGIFPTQPTSAQWAEAIKNIGKYIESRKITRTT